MNGVMARQGMGVWVRVMGPFGAWRIVMRAQDCGDVLWWVGWAAAVGLVAFGQTDLKGQEKAVMGRYAIAIHGGAGNDASRMSKEQIAEVEASMGKALDIGVGVLKGGGTSLDAV